jgi:predicted dehydrogenase
MKRLNIAVLGIGRWGTHWARNIAQHPQTRLVALVDPHRDRLENIRDRFALSEEVVLAADWQEICRLSHLDAVVVATPAATHYELIGDALARGYHVLAEKPLTLDSQECLALSQQAAQQGLQLLVDHTYLFHPSVARGREIVASGQLGEVRYGYATRTNLGPVRYDVDALWDLAIHDLCIFNHWLGASPAVVQARGQTWLSNNRGLADTVWLTAIYAGGFQATIHVSWLNPDKQRRLSVVGSAGTLVFDELNQNAPLLLQKGHFAANDDSFTPQNLGIEAIAVPDAEPLRRVCDAFVTAIQTATPSFSSGELAADLVRVLQAARESRHQDGVAIAIEPLKKIV